MKKISAIVLTLLLMACCANAVLATGSVVVVKPELVTKTDASGVAYIGKMVDATGNEVLIPADSGAVVLTPVDEEQVIADPVVAQKIEAAYEEISSAENLTELTPDLEETLTEMGSAVTSENLVVRELMDVSVYGDYKTMLDSGKALLVTLNLGVKSDDLVILMTKCEDTWEIVPTANVTNNGNGTVDVKFDKLCPVAFVTSTTVVTPPTPVEPEPEKKASAWPWIAAGAAAAAGGGTFLAVKGKKKEKA